MADEAKKITTREGSILSKVGSENIANQRKAASSTAAAQSGSTTTPTVTDTPKVTQTAKAMPSITRPDISSIASQYQAPTTTTQIPTDLLSQRTVTLKKAETPDLLSKTTEEKDVNDTTIPKVIVNAAINAGGKAVQAIANNLYEQGIDWINDKINKLENTRKNVTDVVGKTAIDMFKGVGRDFANQWESGEGIGAVRDTFANTLEGLPRGIARIEYGLAELADWGIDADWLDSLKGNIKSDLDYWENTRVYKKIKETESFSDFLKNPLMYAGGTLGEMLPMFINAWVAVPTTFAQIYGDTYMDYSQDESLSGLTDNQTRLMSLGVAGVNTIIELGSDLIQGIMPWTKPAAKGVEKEVRRKLTKPFSNLVKKLVKGGASEGLEEVFQDEIQDQMAIAAGSDRPSPTWGSRFTKLGISSMVGAILKGGDITIDINSSKEMQAAFNEWSEAVDDIAPGVSKDDKIKLFSAIVAAEVEDANMSEKRVSKYEAQTTELYNKIDKLNKELETTTDENKKQEINRQIEDASKRIEAIDEIINKGNKIMEEVNQQLQQLSQQSELETLKEDMQTPKEVGGENLSEQTMREIKEREVGESAYEQTKKSISIPHTTQEYDSFAEALRQPQNRLLKDMSADELIDLRREINKGYENALYFNQPVSSIRFILRSINEELDNKKDVVRKKSKFKNAKDYVQQMIDIDKHNGDWSKRNDRRLREKYMSQFLKTNLEGDFSAHMPGLKNVNLKQVEGKLTDQKIRDIAEMLSLVSTTFGIDFNKVITDSELSMNIIDNIKDFLYNTGSLGLMTWKATKDQIRELMTNTGRGSMTLGSEIAKMGVAVTLDRGPARAGSIMAHELRHLIDFALSTKEGLPLYWEDRSTMNYTSIIKGDREWKTYKIGTYKPKYYNDWSEILARYAEEYFAYKNDRGVFDELAKRDWYWTEEEFLKLLPKFESFIKDRLGAKLLDEQNQFYNEVVRKINENLFKTTQIEFAERDDMTESEVKYKLAQLESEYARILQTVEGMKGDLKEEMEAYVQLSNLQSNYEMAKAKGEEYLEKLKTTPEQQTTIDTITSTVVPEPPQDPGTIDNGLPQLGGSNIENGINDISEGGKGGKLGDSYMQEETVIKIRKKKNKIKAFRKELSNTIKDIFTPTISRIYNISPRVAGRLITMETQKDINIHRYRQKAKGFVESLGKLKGKQALEVKMALLDYGALASEQGENIEEYKKQEVTKLKEVLLVNGFKEKDINDVFEVLNDIGQQYKDAGLSIALTDMYFPRVVKDYEGLIDYMNRVSGNDIKVNKTSLLIKIRNIQSDPKMTPEEKESKIRNAIAIEFHQPGTTSKHGKERKLGLLSDWGEGIFAYYENPIESLDHYITTMTNAIQRQLFLGGMSQDANITESDILNMDTAESVSTIIGKLVESGQINEDDIDELQKSILAVLNKKPSPKSVTAIKDITYISTITNFLSAINQLDDLGVVILKDRSGLKHIVKTIFGKAGIKYDDIGLDDAYEMFREELGITNWLFKKSFFNMFDRLGKTSFVNTAWESMIHQSKNEKTRKYLYTRLESMYGKESADRMMEKIDSGSYLNEDGQIDIEILRDLLYQLGSTQPIYTSAMPTTYLNNPWARLCYALSSFTLKRIDWLIQGTKEVNAQHGPIVAGAWLMGVSSFLAMFGAVIGDAGDLLKGKKEETFLWQLINKGIDDALKSGGSDMLDSWLKIWDLSEYDLKTYKEQGLWGVFSSKIKPFIFDLGKDITEAITEHDKDEITDLAKYVPIFGKLVYYWCWSDLKENTKSKKGEPKWDFGDEDIEWDFGDNIEWDFGEDDIEWDFS